MVDYISIPSPELYVGENVGDIHPLPMDILIWNTLSLMCTR